MSGSGTSVIQTLKKCSSRSVCSLVQVRGSQKDPVPFERVKGQFMVRIRRCRGPSEVHGRGVGRGETGVTVVLVPSGR